MAKQLVNKNNPIPRYLQVMQLLEDRIRYGEYALGARIPGERELALEFQVSQMTVNKAILALVDSGCLYREQGRGTFVRSDFRPAGPTVAKVGVVVPISVDHVLDDFYMGSLFRGIQRAVANAPVSLSIMEAIGNVGERLLSAPMDAFLIIGMLERDLPAVKQLHAAGKRAVVLGSHWDQMGTPFVDSDNIHGTKAALDHLLSLGHTRIAGVFALANTSNTIERIATFHAFQKEHGLDAPPEFAVIDEENYPTSGHLLSNSARQQVHRLLRRENRPTAFFCGGYFLALETIEAIRSERLRVPDDVSVIGFDDPVSAAHLSPPLTTVRQPLDEMGRRAMTILMEWVQTHREPQRGEVLPTMLIPRASTARVLKTPA